MDEHSIEELKRQRDDARSKAQDAAKAYEAAKARLEAALAEESGWLGQVVEVNASRYDLAADIRALADLWRGADHTRQCNARYGMGGCTCGFDARLDMAITAVINHADEAPNQTGEVDRT